MTLSPLQPNYVTKQEFGSFVAFTKEGFEKVFDHSDTIEGKIDNLALSMDKRFVEQKSYIDAGFNNVFQRLESLESKMDLVLKILQNRV